MRKFTKKEVRRLTELTFYALAKKCFAENKKPIDFIGHRIPLALLDDSGNPFTFKVSKKLALIFTEFIDSEIKKFEKKILAGDSNSNCAPTGIINATRIMTGHVEGCPCNKCVKP